MVKVLLVFGTRPEAIKLCPIAVLLAAQPDRFDLKVCVTGQHRQMLDQVLEVFGVRPQHDLNLMLPGQTLFQSASRILAGLEPVLEQENPDVVLVQGDTTSTLCGALAGFYHGAAIGHVEAGLRTGDLRQPFPEEMNRVLVSRLASIHFAATQAAADNLLREGVAADRIEVTGNSGIDAVLFVDKALQAGQLKPQHGLHFDDSRRLILVTAHRRESFGTGMERICRAIARLAERQDVEVIFPVHPNPNVRLPVERLLGGRPRICLVEPLDYVSFVDVMRRSHLIITDSGGIQEEGPSLGKPILVLREKTERPEAVLAGTVRLVGTDLEAILSAAGMLLDNDELYQRMARAHNPYGDGHASERIAHLTHSFFSKKRVGGGSVASAPDWPQIRPFVSDGPS